MEEERRGDGCKSFSHVDAHGHAYLCEDLRISVNAHGHAYLCEDLRISREEDIPRQWECRYGRGGVNQVWGDDGEWRR